jgi:hypothetical protein
MPRRMGRTQTEVEKNLFNDKRASGLFTKMRGYCEDASRGDSILRGTADKHNGTFYSLSRVKWSPWQNGSTSWGGGEAIILDESFVFRSINGSHEQIPYSRSCRFASFPRRSDHIHCRGADP